MPAGRLQLVTKGSLSKKSKKAKKSKDASQDARIKKLEKTLYASIEKKITDITGSDVPISSSGYANYPMFQLTQGDDVSERIGDKVCLKSHRFRCVLKKVDDTNMMRVILAVTPSTTNLVISDVLEYGDYSVYSTQVFASPYRKRPINAEKTYQVLYDRTFAFDTDVDTFIVDKKFKMGKYGKNLQFATTGSTMPENYQVCLLAISDSGAISHPTISYVFRSHYTDL